MKNIRRCWKITLLGVLFVGLAGCDIQPVETAQTIIDTTGTKAAESLGASIGQFLIDTFGLPQPPKD